MKNLLKKIVTISFALLSCSVIRTNTVSPIGWENSVKNAKETHKKIVQAEGARTYLTSKQYKILNECFFTAVAPAEFLKNNYFVFYKEWNPGSQSVVYFKDGCLVFANLGDFIIRGRDCNRTLMKYKNMKLNRYESYHKLIEKAASSPTLWALDANMIKKFKEADPTWSQNAYPEFNVNFPTYVLGGDNRWYAAEKK